MSRELLHSLIADMVRDSADLLSAEAKDRALDLAVQQYGKDRPAAKVTDVTADGGHELDYPAGYDALTCSVQGIEYPLGRMPPARLTADQWMDYETPEGHVILASVSFAAGEPVRVSWRQPREADDIPERDMEAVAAYAAANLLDQLAAAKSGDSDATLNADSVRSGSKGRDYAERAATQRKRYHDLLGIDTKRVEGVSTMVQVASPASDGKVRFWNRRPL